MNAKCHVIRDAQLLEKDVIKKEQQQEQRRLDDMMEIDRLNAIRIEEEIERKRKEEKLIGAMKIMEQIEENEKVSFLFEIDTIPLECNKWIEVITLHRANTRRQRNSH